MIKVESFVKGKLKNVGYWSKTLIRLLTYILLIDLAFVFIYPFLFMIISSLKNYRDLMNPAIKWLPSTLHWQNFITAFRALNYMVHLKNSLIVVVLATIGHVFSGSFAGYGFARYKFPGNSLLFASVLLVIMTPIQVLLIPLYSKYAELHWTNSYLALVVPSFLGFGLRGALFIFIFRQFFLGIPKDLEEAARIDGCGFLMTFFRIILPTSKSAILVTAVLSTIWRWNDYIEPNIYIMDTKLQLLTQRLPMMYKMLKEAGVFTKPGSEFYYNEAVVMAGTLIAILPVLVIYAFLQKEFVQGIEHTGSKF